MNTQMRRKMLAMVVALFGLPLAVPGPAQAAEKLAGYNAAIGESSMCHEA